MGDQYDGIEKLGITIQRRIQRLIEREQYGSMIQFGIINTDGSLHDIDHGFDIPQEDYTICDEACNLINDTKYLPTGMKVLFLWVGKEPVVVGNVIKASEISV